MRALSLQLAVPSYGSLFKVINTVWNEGWRKRNDSIFVQQTVTLQENDILITACDTPLGQAVWKRLKTFLEEIGADNTKKGNIISHTHLTKNVMLHKHRVQKFVATNRWRLWPW